jgi:transposase
MREGITVEVSAADRGRLEVIVADRNSPQKHVWRARIVLLTADGLGTNEIMRQARTSKVTVWRWQERFMRSGVAGLLRDKTRPSRLAPLPASVHERTVALTLGDPPGEATHWTAEMPVTLHAAADDLAFEDVEGGEQRGRTVALIVVRHGPQAAGLQRQARLGAVERLGSAISRRR